MAKITSLSEIEEKILSLSVPDDIGKMPDDNRQISQSPDLQMSADDVRHDVAVFGRILIRAYAGWRFHDEPVRRRVLKSLLDIYNNAAPMIVAQFFKQLASTIAGVPDAHLKLRFDGRSRGTTLNSERAGVNVGKNLTDNKTPIKTYMRPDGIAVVAWSEMVCPTPELEKQLRDFIPSVSDARALVIDLRFNSGGDTALSDGVAEFLCGGSMRSARRVYTSATPDAMRFMSDRPDLQNKIKQGKIQDGLFVTEYDETQCNADNAYTRPIYILTNGYTASSSEMFIARMKHHPKVILVGDNTMGCEVYGNVAPTFLPHSHIIAQVGMNYREMEYSNFELNGFSPDIRVPDGADAFDITIKDFNIRTIAHQNGNDR